MTTILEKMASAVQDHLRNQGVLYEVDPERPDPSRLMLSTGEAADLHAAISAALMVIRTSSEALEDAVLEADLDIYWGYRADERPGGPRDVINVAIDAILNGHLA